MKRILSTALLTSLSIVLFFLLLLTYLIFRPMIHKMTTPEPDYVIAEDASGDSADASGDLPIGREEWGEWEPGEISMIDMSVFPAGTVLPFVDEESVGQYFRAYDLNDTLLKRISGKSYRENGTVNASELSYLKVIHYNYKHEVQVGEVIVAKDLAEDFLAVFQELYECEYEIYSLVLIENYWEGDAENSDNASAEANNSSAFCDRYVAGTKQLSKHAYGRAIDLNPVQNPYVSVKDGATSTTNPDSVEYLDRSISKAHMITENDDAYRIFTAHGFTWGGEWTGDHLDYMHFEKD